MTLIVDYSHVHRKTTGIERLSLDMFSAEALKGIKTDHLRAHSNPSMARAQWATLPLKALASKRDLFLCSGFPPSVLLTLIAGPRLLTYIHDLFLITRPQDLNATAKYYMRPSFWFVLKQGRHFLVNSQTTADALRQRCRPDATIRVLRPSVANTFNLTPSSTKDKKKNEPLRLLSLGTVEPRKNFSYAAQIRKRLQETRNGSVELHIIGRAGWGADAKILRHEENVFLHGYSENEEIRRQIDQADIFLSTSHDEGLGLPLLEAQHGGKCVAATDIAVYREVLGESGCLLPLDDAAGAAQKIETLLQTAHWREAHKASALANVAAWNAQAEKDRSAFDAWLAASMERGAF
jgi:glycosyltransferase involved in cell wall biosynthesis